MAAIDSIDEQGETGVIPEGDGYLLIPAANNTGYIPIKAVYSPHLTSTLIGENCIMGETKRERDQYTTQTITKHLNESTFTITCVHHRTCISIRVHPSAWPEGAGVPTGTYATSRYVYAAMV